MHHGNGRDRRASNFDITWIIWERHAQHVFVMLRTSKFMSRVHDTIFFSVDNINSRHVIKKFFEILHFLLQFLFWFIKICLIHYLLLCKNDPICIILYDKKTHILLSYNVWSAKKKQKQNIQNRQNKGKPKTKVKTTLLFCFDNNKSTVTQLLRWIY